MEFIDGQLAASTIDGNERLAHSFTKKKATRQKILEQ
jgi:hypothetical protein